MPDKKKLSPSDDAIVEKVLNELKAKLGTAVFMQNDNLIDCSAVVKENVDVAICLAISEARKDMAAKVETDLKKIPTVGVVASDERGSWITVPYTGIGADILHDRHGNFNCEAMCGDSGVREELISRVELKSWLKALKSSLGASKPPETPSKQAPVKG